MSEKRKTKQMEALDSLLRSEVLGGSNKSLYLHKETMGCISSGCIVCSYKLLVRLPRSIRQQCAPNIRPELCKRIVANQKSKQNLHSHSGCLYPPSGNILVLGDGDLSFSLALCRRIASCQSNTSPNIIATTYLTKNQLYQTYPLSASKNVKDLMKYTKPIHGVDATILGTSKCQLSLKGLAGRKYHRVIWNFPCVHSPVDAEDHNQRGKDGQNEEMEDNKIMLQEFFNHVVDLLVPGGEVHLVHKTKPPYNQWNIEDQVSDSGMQLAGAIVFDRAMYPGYVNRKALVGKGSFPISDARTYVFVAPLVLNPTLNIPSIYGTFDQKQQQQKEQQQRQTSNKRRKAGDIILVHNKLLIDVCAQLAQRKRHGDGSNESGNGGSGQKNKKRKR